MKKILSTLMAILVIGSLTSTAFASDSTGEISEEQNPTIEQQKEEGTSLNPDSTIDPKQDALAESEVKEQEAENLYDDDAIYEVDFETGEVAEIVVAPNRSRSTTEAAPYIPRETRSENIIESDIDAVEFLQDQNLMDENGNINFEELEKLPSADGMLVGTQPRNIFGTDNRKAVSNTTAFPYRAVGYVVSYWTNGTTTFGSAFLVGNKIAATAGHNIYNPDTKMKTSKVVFIAGMNGSTQPYGAFTATNNAVGGGYLNGTNTWYDDWGILRFTTSIGGKTGYFGMKKMNSSLVGVTVSTTGYPSVVNGSGGGNKMYTSSGPITKVANNSVYFQNDVSKGNSGGPVHDSNGYTYGIVSKSSTSGNWGPAYRPVIYDFIVAERNK